MPENFVQVSRLPELNSAKPWPIFTQPPGRGGRRHLGCDGRRAKLTLRQPSLLSLALSLARSLSLCLVSQGSAGGGVAQARRWPAADVPRPSVFSLSLSRVVVGLTGEEEKKQSHEREGGCSGKGGRVKGKRKGSRTITKFPLLSCSFYFKLFSNKHRYFSSYPKL